MIIKEIKQWAIDAKQSWSTRRKPTEIEIENDFATDELRTGAILIANRDFELTPELACSTYPIFSFGRVSIVDFFLFPLLFATLRDHRKTGLSDRISEYLLRECELRLGKRFSARELILLIDYFKLIRAVRGWAPDQEIASHKLVEEALQRISSNKRRHALASLISRKAGKNDT